MKHISLKVLFITCLIGFGLISCGGGKSEKNGSGASSPNDVQHVKVFEKIATLADLKKVGESADNMGKSYQLTADIDLSSATGDDSGFPLGWNADDTEIIPFTGNFDGGDHTISNLVITKDAGGYIGLFAKIGGTTSSEIKDLILDEFNIKGTSHIGALAGFADGKINIINVKVTGVNSEAKDEGYVGGLVGKVEGGTITTSSVVGGTVKSTGANVGGLVGSVDNSATTTPKLLISDSYATGAVSGGNSVGGLVGRLKGKIVDSYASGAVTATTATTATTGEAGGLIGRMESGSVSNTYAIGMVSGTIKGGLIGKLEGACTDCTVTNSYFDLVSTTVTEIIGDKGTATIIPALHAGVNGKADIKGDGATPTVYKTVDGKVVIFNGWNDANWTFADGNWPILKWQPKTLRAGAVNQPIASTHICKNNPTYMAVHSVASLKAVGTDAASMAKNYCLTRSIVLTGGFTGFPLGWKTGGSSIISFTGNFDGADHTITGLTVTKDTDNYIGLFAKIGSVTTSSEIKNLELNNFTVTGQENVGALAGYAEGKIKISKIKLNGVNVNGVSSVGSLIGAIKEEGVKINESAVNGGKVNGTGQGANIGGLVGLIQDNSTISSTHVSCMVTGNNKVGGLVGTIKNGGTVTDNYATGDVTGANEVGGLVGNIANGGTVLNSYATGVITATAATSSIKGGLVGKLNDCTAAMGDTAATCSVTNSYFDESGANSGIDAIGVIDVTATTTGLVGVNGKVDITEVIGILGTFKTVGKSAPIFSDWSFDNWKFATGNWPILKWQNETLTAGTPTPTCDTSGYMAVNDVAGLKAIGTDAASMAKGYCLMSDIDLAGESSDLPLGWKTGGSSIISFTGNFDGADHTITGLTVTKDTDNYIGLFAKIGSTTTSSEIKNLNLNNFTVTGQENVGALVGYVDGEVAISKVKINNVMTNGANNVGGLTGYAGGAGGKIIDITVIGGAITGANNVGGMIGYMEGNERGGTVISNSYVTSDVSGIDYVGGFIGRISASGMMSNSYATGVVTTADIGTHKGGLIGGLDTCTVNACSVTNSYFDESGANSGIDAIGVIDVTATTTGLVGVDGANDITEVIGTPGTFKTVGKSTPIFGDWSFDNWKFATGNWPILKWQNETLTAGTPIPTCDTSGYMAVNDVAGLKAIGTDAASMAKGYCLMSDIDLTDESSDFPLGWDADPDYIISFTGNFDGGDHTISNLVINRVTDNYIGLFAKIGGTTSREIKDLHLVDFRITGKERVGALMGEAPVDVTISKVKINNAIINGANNVGGLTGYAGGAGDKIIDITVIGGAITGTKNVGGMIGTMEGNQRRGPTLSNSYATSDVTGEDNVGGLVGLIYAGGIISNSYATGDVTGSYNDVGGLVGKLYVKNGFAGIKISNSYATGDVVGVDNIGGLVGQINGKGEVSNSYATGEVTITGNNERKGGLVGSISCSHHACGVTNSYFDKSGANSGINAIDLAYGTPTITGLVGVAGAGDIKEYATTPISYKTVDNNVEIFVEWRADSWKFAEGNWPILKWQPETLTLGTLKQPNPTIPPLLDESYTDINDIAGLKAIGVDTASMAKNYRLTADIDLASATGDDSGFPLGWASDEANILRFTGNFDGAGHTISNLTVDKPSKKYIGLFSRLDTGGDINDTSSIKNLNLADFKITGQRYVGGLAGDAKNKVTISNVTVSNVTAKAVKGRNDQGFPDGGSHVGGLLGIMKEGATVMHAVVIGGTVIGESSSVGGLVGAAYAGVKILNSSATIVVEGDSAAGGLVGYLGEYSEVSNSYATGSVTGYGNSFGGLVGSATKIKISNSYATGDVKGVDVVGGLVGEINDGGYILNSYATGKVTATWSSPIKGGLVSLYYGCSSTNVCEVTNSHFDKSGINSGINAIAEINGVATTTGLVGVDGASDIEVDADGGFQTIASPNDKIFVDWNKDADIWEIIAGAWPTLKP